ncbi:hypothetical protein [Cryptosporangium aurantiacum]|uniref:Uncharacterized protein n=1 Tax=Cryptosporangium aurantiacum TaxID=134849 RepID=A0A1M7KR34_9ACTN|nr:hypothetical protein [Cryptosporangium aurantiacum]SHM67925.1 hypothetical protein SAMN05443668_1011230 [Cryptosporangium aurantiacum]
MSSDTLVLRAESTGGFVPATFTYGRLPTVSIYADGRVITEGPQIAIYPGPALPNLLVRTISRTEVDRLVAAARRAGVGSPTDYGTPGVADATTTRFTLVEGGRTLTAEVYALSEAMETDQSLTAAQREARARMRGLLATLSDPASGSGEQRYQPAAIATIVTAYANTDPENPQPARAWRGAALPGRVVGPADVSCALTTGAAVRTVLADAASANAATPWTYEGRRWSLMFRPLLPDETGCESLGR